MVPTFLAFQTASRALAASQAKINTTGNNIANVNTEGYSRQRVDLSSISSSGYTQKYATASTSVSLGVEVTGISQTRDPFLDARYRNEASGNGQYTTLLAGLSDLENVFDEIETNGLQSELSNFASQLQTLSQTPTRNDIALIVRTAAQKVTQIMNVYAQQTTEVRNQQIYDLSNVVVNNDFNSLVENIAALNIQIRDEQTHGNTPNELYDKRNSFIDKLSGIANIKVTMSPEKISETMTIETLSISIYDKTSGTSIGIVQNGLYNTLSVNNSGNPSEPVRIEINSSFGDLASSDITNYFSSGAMKGYLDLINGKGAYAAAGENDFRGALHYQNAMDTVASKFADVFNALNNIEIDGPPATVTDKPLFQASSGTAITAANIRISTAWLSDPTYITTTKDSTTATGLPAFPGGGDNVLRMVNALSASTSFNKDVANPASEIMFKGTFSEYMSGLVGELALDIDLNNNFAETSTRVLSSLYNSRESISGINLDEEGINLMAYQKAYNAAARYFTVLDEALDIVINRMGVVGR